MPKNRTSKTAVLRKVQRQINSPLGVPYASLKKLEAHLSADERQQVVKNMAVSDAWRNMSRRQRKRVLAAMTEPKAKAGSSKVSLEQLASTARAQAREKQRRATMHKASTRPVKIVKAAAASGATCFANDAAVS